MIQPGCVCTDCNPTVRKWPLLWTLALGAAVSLLFWAPLAFLCWGWLG